jgi:hypothetical protein
MAFISLEETDGLSEVNYPDFAHFLCQAKTIRVKKINNVVPKNIMDRSKIVAVLTGAIAIILSLAYLLLVQLLDFRGEMVPAPMSAQPALSEVAQVADSGTILLTLD